MAVTVTFYGVRGSIPCCSPEYTEYGGNTSCVQVDLNGRIIVLDVGSGARELGEALSGKNVKDITLLISHTHWDHICGFPFFRPVYDQSCTINVYAPPQPDGTMTKDVFATMMSSPFFPLPLHALPSDLHFHSFRQNDSLSVADDSISIETISLPHPNGATGYRLNYDGKSICYVSDYEHSSVKPSADLKKFVRNADLMIYDAMYTPEEYSRYKGWGHSTWEQAALLTKLANVKRTALFHHSPSHTDGVMRQIEADAQGKDERLFAARERITLTV